MDLTYKMALEVACHEAIVRQAYLDSQENWTWSVGLTDESGHRVERYINNPQPLEHCLAVYVWALNNYAKKVRAEFDSHSYTEEQFAAALSFHWNTGAIGSASWIDLWKSGDIAGAKDSIMDWRKPPEIIDRRRKERDLFFDGVWSNDGTMTEWTRVKPNGYIDWNKAQKINVEDELMSLLAAPKAEVEEKVDRQVAELKRLLNVADESMKQIHSITKGWVE